MPITRRQFELGIDDLIATWMTKVHAFLSRNRDQAFTEKEIAEALKDDIKAAQPELRRARGWPPDRNIELEPPIRTALAKLEEIFAADARKVHEDIYYAYLRDLPDIR